MKLRHLHQLALSCGEDIDATVSFYRDVLDFSVLGRFDPPGIAFIDAGGTRLLLSPDAPAARLYFEVDHLAEASTTLETRGLSFKSEPVMVHRDDAGQFGDIGTEEWMRFFDDPAGNLVAIVERRQALKPSAPDTSSD